MTHPRNIRIRTDTVKFANLESDSEYGVASQNLLLNRDILSVEHCRTICYQALTSKIKVSAIICEFAPNLVHVIPDLHGLELN